MVAPQSRSRGAELDFWSGLQRQQLCNKHPGWVCQAKHTEKNKSFYFGSCGVNKATKMKSLDLWAIYVKIIKIIFYENLILAQEFFGCENTQD